MEVWLSWRSYFYIAHSWDWSPVVWELWFFTGDLHVLETHRR